MKTMLLIAMLLFEMNCFGQRYFIKVKDGKAVDYPIQEDNFRQAFPNIDVENLPDTFALVQNVPIPKMKVYQKYIKTNFEVVGKQVKETHEIKDFTNTEKKALQNKVKNSMEKSVPKDYVFVDSLCSYVPQKMIKQ